MSQTPQNEKVKLLVINIMLLCFTLFSLNSCKTYDVFELSEEETEKLIRPILSDLIKKRETVIVKNTFDSIPLKRYQEIIEGAPKVTDDVNFINTCPGKAEHVFNFKTSKLLSPSKGILDKIISKNQIAFNQYQKERDLGTRYIEFTAPLLNKEKNAALFYMKIFSIGEGVFLLRKNQTTGEWKKTCDYYFIMY